MCIWLISIFGGRIGVWVTGLRDWVGGGVVISLLINGFSRYLDYVDAKSLGLSPDAWLSIGLGMFFASVIALLIWWQKQLGRTSQEKKIKSEAIEGEKQPIFSFYINRTELMRTTGTLADLLSVYERVWAIFHTGEISKVSGVLAKCRIERLILTDPRDKYMMKKLEPRGNNAKQYQDQIRQVAEMASKNGSDVRYYKGPIGSSLIIADTMRLADDKFSEQAWAQIETGIPFLSPQDRPSFVIYNKDNGKDAFNAFLSHFNTMWNRSEPAPPEDLSYGRST